MKTKNLFYSDQSKGLHFLFFLQSFITRKIWNFPFSLLMMSQVSTASIECSMVALTNSDKEVQSMKQQEKDERTSDFEESCESAARQKYRNMCDIYEAELDKIDLIIETALEDLAEMAAEQVEKEMEINFWKMQTRSLIDENDRLRRIIASLQKRKNSTKQTNKRKRIFASKQNIACKKRKI